MNAPNVVHLFAEPCSCGTCEQTDALARELLATIRRFDFGGAHAFGVMHGALMQLAEAVEEASRDEGWTGAEGANGPDLRAIRRAVTP